MISEAFPISTRCRISCSFYSCRMRSLVTTLQVVNTIETDPTEYRARTCNNTPTSTRPTTLHSSSRAPSGLTPKTLIASPMSDGYEESFHGSGETNGVCELKSELPAFAATTKMSATTSLLDRC